MKPLIPLICIISILLGCNWLRAQSDTGTSAIPNAFLNAPPTSPTSGKQPESPETPTGQLITVKNDVQSSPLSSFEFLLSMAILAFGVFVVGTEVYLAKQKIIKSEHIYKIVVLTLIIIGSLLLVTAGYSNNQINGVLGLLGGISGYLVGKMDNHIHKPENTN